MTSGDQLSVDQSDPDDIHQRTRGAQQRYRVPADARQVLLIRHGSSVGATLDTVQLGELTISDPVLTDEGVAQAHLLARHLANEPISAIFVTPLRRTAQTAAPLATALGMAPVVLPQLREVHLGDWEHSFYDHAAAGHPLLRRMFAEERWDVIPNAESVVDVATRVRAGIDAIIEAVPAGTTCAVFSHAGVIAELCRQATESRAFAFMAPENTSVSRLIVMADGHWKLRSFNDVTHLGYY